MVIGLAGYALLGCAPFLVHDLVGIVLLRFALGFPLIALIVASTAMIAHRFDGIAQVRWLGLQSAFGSLASVAVALIGGGLGQIGWREPFLVHCVALVWIAALLTFVERDATFVPTDRAGPSALAPLEWRGLLINLSTTSFASIVMLTAVVQVSFVLSGGGISDPASIGLGVSIISACAAAGSLVAPHVAKLLPRQGLAVAFLLSTVGLILMACGSDFALIVVGGSLTATGAGVAFPLLVGQSVGSARPELRGRVSGMWTSALFIGQFLNAPVFALLNGATGSIQMTVVALALVCAAIACVQAFRSQSPTEA